nr:VanZ family protein [Marinifaba aquimaris]
MLFLRDVGPALKKVPHIDKILHFLIFFGLSYIAHRAFSHPIWMKVAHLTAYGAFVEIAQSFRPNRQASFADLVADFVGIICFFACWHFYQKHKNRKSLSTDALNDG